MKKLSIIMLFGTLFLNNCTMKLYDVYYDPTMNNKKNIRTIDNLHVTEQKSKDIVNYKIQGTYKEQLPFFNDTIIKKTVKTKYNFFYDLGGFVIGLPFAIALSPIFIPVNISQNKRIDKNEPCEKCPDICKLKGIADDKTIINSNTLIKYDINCHDGFWNIYWSLLPFTSGSLRVTDKGSSATNSKFEKVMLNSIDPNINQYKVSNINASEIRALLFCNNILLKQGNCSTNFSINLKEEALKAYYKRDSLITVCIRIGDPTYKINCKDEFCYSYKTENFLPPQTSITDKIIVTPSDATLLVGTDRNKLIKSNSSLFIEKSAFDFSPKLPAKYIKVERDGYRTQEKYLEVTDKDRTTEIILEEVQTGYLKLTSTEDNVEILIDGEYQGLLSKSIPLNKKIEVGSHLITAKKKYFLTNTIKAEIEFKQVFSHNFKLVKADSNWDEDATKSNILQAQGSLTVVTERKDLVVYIDGVKRVPSFEFNNIAAGEYDMRVVGKGVDRIIHIVIEDKSRVFIDLDEELKK